MQSVLPAETSREKEPKAEVGRTCAAEGRAYVQALGGHTSLGTTHRKDSFQWLRRRGCVQGPEPTGPLWPQWLLRGDKFFRAGWYRMVLGKQCLELEIN